MDDRKRAAIKKLIERNTRRDTASKEAARASLVRDGLYAPDGRPAPEFRRERRRSKSNA